MYVDRFTTLYVSHVLRRYFWKRLTNLQQVGLEEFWNMFAPIDTFIECRWFCINTNLDFGWSSLISDKISASKIYKQIMVKILWKPFKRFTDFFIGKKLIKLICSWIWQNHESNSVKSYILLHVSEKPHSTIYRY